MLTEEPVLIEEFVRTGKVRIVFRDVLSHGEYSIRTHEAGACAAQQGYFWDLHEILYRDQPEVSSTPEAGLAALMKKKAAAIAGLDSVAFGACVDGRQMRERVTTVDAEQRKRGISTQPIFEVAGQRLFGSRPIAAWRELLTTATR